MLFQMALEAFVKEKTVLQCRGRKNIGKKWNFFCLFPSEFPECTCKKYNHAVRSLCSTPRCYITDMVYPSLQRATAVCTEYVEISSCEHMIYTFALTKKTGKLKKR